MKSVALNEKFFEGAVSVEIVDGACKPWRLPHDRLRLFDNGHVGNAAVASGVRLRFATDAAEILLRVAPQPQLDAGPQKFDLTIEGELLATAILSAGQDEVRFSALPAGTKTVELWLPQHGLTVVRELLVEDGASVRLVPDERPKWITYGSSITHCSKAHSPARTWPATVARKHKLNLTSLGFGGQCHLDPMMGVLIRDLPADILSLKLGINTGGSLGARTFPFLAIGLVRILREKHPTTPVALISPIISPPREDTPQKSGQTLNDMRKQLADACQRLRDCGDANVHYFDGRELFGADLVENYLPDLLHPNGDGYEKLGANFSRVVMEKMLPEIRRR
ncbi:MAG TPA: GDSL family lipase [Phycisphaerales bacterium]|nr:GDSL family lipase [Phycisphaerales bacterium]